MALCRIRHTRAAGNIAPPLIIDVTTQPARPMMTHAGPISTSPDIDQHLDCIVIAEPAIRAVDRERGAVSICSALSCTYCAHNPPDWRAGPLCSSPERAACLSAGRPSQIMCNSRSCFYWASAHPSTSAPSSATPRLQSGKCTAAGLVADAQCRDAGTPSCTRTVSAV